MIAHLTDSQDQPFVLFGFRISCAEMPVYTPAGNSIGSDLLQKLLNERLNNAGLGAEAGVGGPLNECRGIVSVNEFEPGLRIIRDTLLETFSTFATQEVFYFDHNEMIWRSADTGNALPNLHNFLNEVSLHIAVHSAKLQQFISAYRSNLKQPDSETKPPLQP